MNTEYWRRSNLDIDSVMPESAMLLRAGQCRSIDVLYNLQAILADVCRSSDVCFRASLGLVLLDVGDGECCPVVVEVGLGSWYPPQQGVQSGI